MLTSSLHTKVKFSVSVLLKKINCLQENVRAFGLGVGDILFPDSGKSVFNGQNVIKKEGECLLDRQTKNAVMRSENPIASKQVLQRLAVGDHMWYGL